MNRLQVAIRNATMGARYTYEAPDATRRWTHEVVPFLRNLYDRMRPRSPRVVEQPSEDEIDLIGTEEWTTGGVENEYGSTEGPHANHDAQVCFKEINK